MNIKLVLSTLFIIFLFAACSKMSHYEQGKEYLTNKQYSEALSEFQKVDAGEKDFRLAQSKINYIQGLLSFRDSLFESAEVQLMKVAGEDEYYHESQLMLDKINQRKLTMNAPRTDTLIVKQEVSTEHKEIPEGKIKATEQTDADLTKKFVSDQRGLITQFESAYQSARTVGVSSKENYVKNMQSIVNRLNSISYNAKEKNADALELRSRAAAWMNKRIEFIKKLIADNSISETGTSRSLKEEGDKMYAGVTNMLKKF